MLLETTSVLKASVSALWPFRWTRKLEVRTWHRNCVLTDPRNCLATPPQNWNAVSLLYSVRGILFLWIEILRESRTTISRQCEEFLIIAGEVWNYHFPDSICCQFVHGKGQKLDRMDKYYCVGYCSCMWFCLVLGHVQQNFRWKFKKCDLIIHVKFWSRAKSILNSVVCATEVAVKILKSCVHRENLSQSNKMFTFHLFGFSFAVRFNKLHLTFFKTCSSCTYHKN